MLEAVGIGVAMGNAKDEVKAKADFVCQSVENDGIYHYCVENKLIFFDTVSVETAVVKDEFEVTAGAQKRKMRVSVKRSAALTVLEEKIRRKKVLQEIVERDQEE